MQGRFFIHRLDNVGATGLQRSWTDNLLWHHTTHLIDFGLWVVARRRHGRGRDSGSATSTASTRRSSRAPGSRWSWCWWSRRTTTRPIVVHRLLLLGRVHLRHPRGDRPGQLPHRRAHGHDHHRRGAAEGGLGAAERRADRARLRERDPRGSRARRARAGRCCRRCGCCTASSPTGMPGTAPRCCPAAPSPEPTPTTPEESHDPRPPARSPSRRCAGQAAPGEHVHRGHPAVQAGVPAAAAARRAAAQPGGRRLRGRGVHHAVHPGPGGRQHASTRTAAATPCSGRPSRSARRGTSSWWTAGATRAPPPAGTC